ncbi:alcohol-forming fatty acyl-CoA reductase-like [Gossypium australe]|uniref:Alcohol-forming fatty acyl-CoA reductase-like n=1 Tax=Gossypium australe TaxID=47621 RepID=A0A5B6X229_9ROSI|nr:alcohol-forming fatty acyl-CoA reductase-like [Gossypium australe]
MGQLEWRLQLFLLFLLGYNHAVTVGDAIWTSDGGGVGLQQPLRDRGQARGGNSLGRRQRALGRGAGHTKTRQPALIYAARCREDGDTPNVITGTFLIFDVPYFALIDIGSTHSYIACSVFENLGLSVESTSSEVTVISPLGQPVQLVEHRVSLDCTSKRVVLRTKDDVEVVIIGERRDYLSNVIFVLVAEKLVWKGCEAYLAYVSVLNSGDSFVRNIRTVKDFLDVFPDELRDYLRIRKWNLGLSFL